MNILIIDDDPQFRRLLVRILKGAGYTVSKAINGRDGLDLFRLMRPALVITDIVMPDMEGIEMIREMRAEASTLPILAISGEGPPLYLRAAVKLGASAALPKPSVPMTSWH